MKKFPFALCFLFLLVWLFPSSAVSMEEEVVFELKRENKKSKKQSKNKKVTPLRFKRKSFSFSKDFLIYNEHPTSNIKKGTVLRVNIPYPVIASFTEEFPLYGVVTYPFRAVLSGKIKAIKNANKALITFDEIIVNGEKTAIESFPVFVNGDLKESLFKDIALNFFESLPSVLALTLRTQIPQAGIHFINTDLKNKVGKLSVLEEEKKQSLQYLELPNIKLLKIVIK